MKESLTLHKTILGMDLGGRTISLAVGTFACGCTLAPAGSLFLLSRATSRRPTFSPDRETIEIQAHVVIESRCWRRTNRGCREGHGLEQRLLSSPGAAPEVFPGHAAAQSQLGIIGLQSGHLPAGSSGRDKPLKTPETGEQWELLQQRVGANRSAESRHVRR